MTDDIHEAYDYVERYLYEISGIPMSDTNRLKDSEDIFLAEKQHGEPLLPNRSIYRFKCTSRYMLFDTRDGCIAVVKDEDVYNKIITSPQCTGSWLVGTNATFGLIKVRNWMEFEPYLCSCFT